MSGRSLMWCIRGPIMEDGKVCVVVWLQECSKQKLEGVCGKLKEREKEGVG